MEELQIRRLEGRWGAQVSYGLHYPTTLSGNTPFDWFWRQRALQLRQYCARENGQFPTHYTSEWQETRWDARFCSGFLDVSRRVGYGDWTLWRISATFSPKSKRPLPLSSLLGRQWKQIVYPAVLERMEPVANGETPFFCGWQRRLSLFLEDGRYYLTAEGLCLWFPQNVLAPKNAGLPTVLLPYNQIPGLQAFLPDD